MPRIDLNCDLGEGAPHDAQIMPLITSANIACGVHAGDESTIRSTVELAVRHGVAIGAHPSLNDRANFGRREITVTPAEVRDLVRTQTNLLRIISRQCGGQLRHVKPHGALYNMAARDEALANAVAEAVHAIDPALVLFGLAGSKLLEAGRRRGLPVASEVFADRAYQADGSLLPRSQPGAFIESSQAVCDQVILLARYGEARTLDGQVVNLVADTVCVHGDGKNALFYAQRIRRELRDLKIEVKAFGT